MFRYCRISHLRRAPLRLQLARFSSQLSTFFQSEHAPDSSRSTGLFGNPQLTSPRGFTKFTNDSLNKARTLTSELLSGQVPQKECITRLDVLSDVICKVVDMAAFVRLSHPDERMLKATDDAHQLMFDFMNQLNTSHELYDMVCNVLKTEELTPEERRVGEILKHDFEKTGLQFKNPDNLFVQCSNVVSNLGQEFLQNISPAVPYLTLNSRELQGFNPSILKQLATFTGKVQLPLDSQLGDLALQTVENRETREKIWRAMKSSSQEQVDILTSILTHRHGLAVASGYSSFASYELSDKLMENPENVSKFLDTLSDTIKPKAMKELETITPVGLELEPWDHTYYVSKQNSSKRGQIRDSLSSYFSLGNVLQGISDTCEKLFGIRFEPGKVATGEMWSPEVRRLDVYQGNTRIGMIYCDLFQREGKSPYPAHFTIQCSRQVWPWETDEYNSPNLEVRETSTGVEKFQLPIIALVCDFWVQNGRCLLSFTEVQTLWHEMGHAVHSMIGRTHLHNVSGTRCATDFVELPSILMEKFSSAPQVLATYARHYETGNPLPMNLFNKYQALSTSTENWETYHQILLSLIDQRLHSRLAGKPDFNTDAVVRDLIKHYSLFPNVFSRSYAQFGHLVSYGATYYSYLLDRCLANIIWDKLFAKDPLSAEGGEIYKNSVLKWGGSRPPQDCIREVIGDVGFDEIAKFI